MRQGLSLRDVAQEQFFSYFKMPTLQDLRNATIATTDVGDLLIVDGRPQHEFELPGKVTKIRASMMFLEIEGEKFTAHKQPGINPGDIVTCIIKPVIKDNEVNLAVRSVIKE